MDRRSVLVGLASKKEKKKALVAGDRLQGDFWATKSPGRRGDRNREGVRKGIPSWTEVIG